MMKSPSIAKMLQDCSEAEALKRIKAMAEPLSTRLAHYVELLATNSPDFASAYQAFVERLSVAEIEARGPQVGDAFPSFILPDQDGRLVIVDNLIAERPLVLSFNRGHWCALCQIELDALNKAVNGIEAAGGSLVAIIPEPQVKARQFRAESALDFKVLCDMDLAFAASLDLAVYIGEDLRNLYLANGIDVGAYQQTEGWFLPVPATFVIGADRRVVARYVDPDFRRRMEVEDILGALRMCSSPGPSRGTNRKRAKGG